MDLESLSSMVEQLEKMTSRKTKEADVHMIDNTSVLLLPMQTQLLDLINNRFNLLKHLTESTLCYPCVWQISTLTCWKGS